LSFFELSIFEWLAQHSQLLTKDAKPFAFRAGFPFQPLVKLQSALDMHRGAFTDAGLSEVCLLSHHSDFDESGFLTPFVAAPFLPAAINCEPEFGDRRALGGVSDFRVTGRVSSDHNKIQTMHD
jgi:hypothetical protein